MELLLLWISKPIGDKMREAKNPVPVGALNGQFKPWVNPRLWWVEGHSVGQRPMKNTLKLKTAVNNRYFLFTEVISTLPFNHSRRVLSSRSVNPSPNWEMEWVYLLLQQMKLGP
jgi:hypothetical protein